jgi:RNA polymerase sigma-70 factor, ECF subfamily
MSNSAGSSGHLPPEDRFPVGTDFERFRNYLRLLARMQLASRHAIQIDPSDMVQQTLLEAFQKREQFRGDNEAEWAGWLRAILARNVTDALRAQGRLKRDVRRERSLEQEMAESSARLGAWLAADNPSPSEIARRHEQAIELADALARLSADQREALVLHYWQGCTITEVGNRLERTPGSVAGLLKRGLKNLREQLGARWNDAP